MSTDSNYDDWYTDHHNLEEFGQWLIDAGYEANDVPKDEWESYLQSKWIHPEYLALFEDYLYQWFHGQSEEHDDREP